MTNQRVSAGARTALLLLEAIWPERPAEWYLFFVLVVAAPWYALAALVRLVA